MVETGIASSFEAIPEGPECWSATPVTRWSLHHPRAGRTGACCALRFTALLPDLGLEPKSGQDPRTTHLRRPGYLVNLFAEHLTNSTRIAHLEENGETFDFLGPGPSVGCAWRARAPDREGAGTGPPWARPRGGSPLRVGIWTLRQPNLAVAVLTIAARMEGVAPGTFDDRRNGVAQVSKLHLQDWNRCFDMPQYFRS